MLSAVHFDDEFASVTREVRVERTNGCLSAKMTLVERQCAKITPQLALGVRHVAAKPARAGYSFIAWARRPLHPPTPDPSPPLRGGRGEEKRNLPLQGGITLTAHDRRHKLHPNGIGERNFMNKIVESILAEFSKDNGIEGLDEDDRFEHLTSYLAVRRHFSRALDLNTIIVGDGGDTGVDAIAIIVNGQIMTDVDQVQEMLTQNEYLEATFIFVQAERSSKFEGAKIGTIRAGVNDFFRDVPTLVQNENVQDAFEIKKTIFDLASKFGERPSCHIIT